MNEPLYTRFDEKPTLWAFDEKPFRWKATSMKSHFDEKPPHLFFKGEIGWRNSNRMPKIGNCNIDFYLSFAIFKSEISKFWISSKETKILKALKAKVKVNKVNWNWTKAKKYTMKFCEISSAFVKYHLTFVKIS
jgi:hypothetical protein